MLPYQELDIRGVRNRVPVPKSGHSRGDHVVQPVIAYGWQGYREEIREQDSM